MVSKRPAKAAQQILGKKTQSPRSEKKGAVQWAGGFLPNKCWQPEAKEAATLGSDIMSDNVIPLGNITRLDLPVDHILDAAKNKTDGGGVVVIGWDKDGELYFSSSIADGGEVLWLLERAKIELLNVDP